MNKEIEFKYFIGDEESKTMLAVLMLMNNMMFVIDETRDGQVINVHMKPQLH